MTAAAQIVARAVEAGHTLVVSGASGRAHINRGDVRTRLSLDGNATGWNKVAVTVCGRPVDTARQIEPDEVTVVCKTCAATSPAVATTGIAVDLSSQFRPAIEVDGRRRQIVRGSTIADGIGILAGYDADTDATVFLKDVFVDLRGNKKVGQGSRSLIFTMRELELAEVHRRGAQTFVAATPLCRLFADLFNGADLATTATAMALTGVTVSGAS